MFKSPGKYTFRFPCGNPESILLLLVWLLISGCESARPVYSSGPVAQGTEPYEVITKSLFDSKDRTISEEDIQRLLNGSIRLPDSVRVALFKYSSSSINRYYTNWWTDEEYLKTQQSFVDTLTQAINASAKVKKVFPVPSLMSNANPNMVQLREIAVRLQADVLIVYAISSDIYYKYRMFQKNQAKAFATCEMILLDTRTGVIPHSSVVTREAFVVKDEADLSDTETRKKAERAAVLSALLESGKSVSEFLND